MPNIFEQQATAESAVQLATVYEKRENNGRRFEVEYSGLCEDLVRSRAERAKNEKDTMASPSLGTMRKDGDMFCITLTYYSVD